MIDIVIFGIGYAYKNKKEFFSRNKDIINIVAFLDNNDGVQGQKTDGIYVYSPSDIKKLNFDAVLILSEKFSQEMKNQLSALGIAQDKIWDISVLKQTVLRGIKNTYKGKSNNFNLKKKILIITTEMNTSGGILTAIYAAEALQTREYDVMLAAPDIEEEMLEGIIEKKINITLWPSLPYIYEEDKTWIKDYDVVLVNVFQMMNCTCKIGRWKPLLWWIHEGRMVGEKDLYTRTKEEYSDIDTSEWMKCRNIFCVSDVAKKCFNYYYPDVDTDVLPFGIPDRYCGITQKKYTNTIFAVIARFDMCKNQKIIFKTLDMLSEMQKREIEIWFIGKMGNIGKELQDKYEGKCNVKFFDSVTHEEVIELLTQIDCVVCPSVIETMSMSIIEGMMFGKLCITTNTTGIAHYIENGKNGFIVEVNNSAELAECMSWIINNKDRWFSIGQEARKTYESEFTLEKLGERLESAMISCIAKRNGVG